MATLWACIKVVATTLTYKVSDNAKAQNINKTPFSVHIVGFSSTAGFKVVSNKAGSVYDHTGNSLAAIGYVRVAAAADVGLLAYVRDGEQEALEVGLLAGEAVRVPEVL